MLRRTRSLETAAAGRVVLVTGASSGIGRALALKLGAAGAVVLLVARRRERLEETRVEVEKRGGRAHAYACDLSDPIDIDRMAALMLARHAHVDVLVNNAGRSIRRPVNRSYERFHDFQRTMQLNYFGAVRLILNVLPSMRERRTGQIVNVSTAGVQTSAPMFSAYLASKAALDAFARSIGHEVAADGVAISTVYMPLVRTPMIVPTTAYAQWPALTPDQAADLVCRAIRTRRARVAQPLGTLGQVGYAVAPQRDAVLNALIARLRLGRRWRSIVAAGAMNECTNSPDADWRDTFRRRLERSQVATDPDEVRRLAGLLGGIPLFSRCSFSELHHLAATAYPVAFNEGDVLCVQGMAASDCYAIVEGDAAVSVDGTDVGRVAAGDVVGERGPIEERPRSATVIATSHVLAYAISCERLRRLLDSNADVASHMRQLVGARYGLHDVRNEASATQAAVS
jgi:NAD(P)-dependent dehydrogenase (short-subunit alcohol dehydrogenase family)